MNYQYTLSCKIDGLGYPSRILIYSRIVEESDFIEKNKATFDESNLSSLEMYLFGIKSASKIEVSSDPLAQRNNAWLGVLTPGQIPPFAARTAMSRFLLSMASSCNCLYVFHSKPLRGFQGGMPFCSL